MAVADAGYASFSLPTTGCIQNSLYITLCPWPFGFFILLPPFVHPFHLHGIVRIGARVSVLAFFSTKQPPCTDVAPSARTLSAVLTYAWKAIRTLSAEPRHQHSLTKCPSCMPFEQPLGEWVIERMQRNFPIYSVWNRERCLTDAPNLEGNSTICRYSSLG